MADIGNKDYNYIWDKWIKAYRGGNFLEMEAENMDTLIKARGFLHQNHVHVNDWQAFNKYIDDRKSAGQVKKVEISNTKQEENRSKEWWHKPLYVAITSIILTNFIQFYFNSYSTSRQKAELDQFKLMLTDKNNEIVELKNENKALADKKPEIPVTVIDKATGNQLYIGRPIPRPTHYEFPITLNDGQGFYRIDQYNILNQFKGMLIIKKEPAQQSE